MLKTEIAVPTPIEMSLHLAEKCRQRRLFEGLSRKTLSRLSDVPESTIKRFEQSGRISLTALLRIAFALNTLTPFGSLFDLPTARSMAELESVAGKPLPKRGRR